MSKQPSNAKTTPEQRAEAVQSYLSGKESMAAISRRLGLHPSAAFHWVRKHRQKQAKPKTVKVRRKPAAYTKRSNHNGSALHVFRVVCDAVENLDPRKREQVLAAAQMLFQGDGHD